MRFCRWISSSGSSTTPATRSSFGTGNGSETTKVLPFVVSFGCFGEAAFRVTIRALDMINSDQSCNDNRRARVLFFNALEGASRRFAHVTFATFGASQLDPFEHQRKLARIDLDMLTASRCFANQAKRPGL